MESQRHGVLFEDRIIQSITGKTKSDYQRLLENSYTASMDIEQGTLSDRDYSIKTSKNSVGIGCGDIQRFIHHCLVREFTLVVGGWHQVSPDTKHYTVIWEFDITPLHYPKLWGGITPTVVEPFCGWVKSIPPGRSAQQANRKIWKQRREEIYTTHGRGIFTIDAKIDSGSQRRVQCGVKLADLVAAGIPHRKYIAVYRGIPLPHEQESRARQRS